METHLAGIPPTLAVRAEFGGQVEVPEGKYVFSTEYGGKEWRAPVWVDTGRVSSVAFDGTGVR